MPTACSPPILASSLSPGRFALGKSVVVSASGLVQQSGPPDPLTATALGPQLAPSGSQALVDAPGGDGQGWGDTGPIPEVSVQTPPPPFGPPGAPSGPSGLGLAALGTLVLAAGAAGFLAYEAWHVPGAVSAHPRRAKRR